ncbi:M67 family metallopeptidase [Nitrosomonas communis]|uniref:M67 family metallopeptidase n=1 Tax=Nitrosomonas communis TaxID=44574 RepID=UPI0026EDBD25|nr:M67 family metallopeptidase [Nitrosomonas communis]MCO6427654.1 M67 family metallopeptidase [Nitrosomonas communis]
MLTIHIELIEAMLAQANQDHPIETCGVIAGIEGSDIPSRLIPMRNVANSQTFFQFDPQQQLQVWKEMAARGEEPVVIYHSHTSSSAYPSRTDIEYASEPQSHYVIIPTDPSYKREIRSFRILHGMIVEERIRILDKHKSTAGLSKVA